MPKMIVDEGYIDGEDEDHAREELEDYLVNMKGWNYDSAELEDLGTGTYKYIAFKEKRD
jgi:hypothetical protein